MHVDEKRIRQLAEQAFQLAVDIENLARAAQEAAQEPAVVEFGPRPVPAPQAVTEAPDASDGVVQKEVRFQPTYRPRGPKAIPQVDGHIAIRDLAEEIGIPKGTIQGWFAEGYISGIHVGQARYVLIKNRDAYLLRRLANEAPRGRSLGYYVGTQLRALREQKKGG